jgi:hypothetical protein
VLQGQGGLLRMRGGDLAAHGASRRCELVAT